MNGHPQSFIPPYYQNVQVNFTNKRSTIFSALDTRTSKKVCIKYVPTLLFYDLYTQEEICKDNLLNETRVLHHMISTSEANRNRDINDPLRYDPKLDDYFIKFVELLHIPLFDYFFIVTEWVSGEDLITLYEASPQIQITEKESIHELYSEEERVFLTTELFKIVRHLHDNHFISHCDLSMENIRYDRDTKKIVLIDFGAARLHSHVTGAVGKTYCLSREGMRYEHHMKNATPYSSRANDLFSLGVLFLIFRFSSIAFGKASYAKDANYKFMCNYKKFSFNETVRNFYRIQPFEEVFFVQWLTAHEKERPTLKDVYKSQYFQLLLNQRAMLKVPVLKQEQPQQEEIKLVS